MKKFLSFFLIIISAISIYPQKRALTVEDLWKMKRIGAYDVSPDGKTIAFAVTTFDMDANKGNSDIWLIDFNGKNLRPLKNSDANESSPKFLPDGKSISYQMKGQIWTCDLEGKNDVQLTNIYSGASGVFWAKDGKKILFVSSVYPDCTTQQCN